MMRRSMLIRYTCALMVVTVLYHRLAKNEEREYQRYASNTINDFRHHSAPKDSNKKPKRSGEESKSVLNRNKIAPIGKGKKVIWPTDDPKLVDEYHDRRRYTKKVNEFKYDFILTPRKTCDNETYMIILVHSFHPYHDRRTSIRSTWGGAATGHHPWPRRAINKKIILLFVLGIHPQPDMNSAIEKESQQFGDIIQGNFFDAYVNLTLKSLLGLKYVSMYCKHIEYLVKSDDDMIINMPYLLKLLDEKKMKRSIMGPLNRGSKVYRMGKWKVSREDFPLQYYPQYESGAAYVMTNDIVADLYNISHYVPRFNVDDAYITGVLGKIIGIHHEEQRGFAFLTDKSPSACDILENKKVAGTKMTPAKLKIVWNEMNKGINCTQKNN